MDSMWLLALGLGVVTGLRTFTAVAAIGLSRGGVWGYILAAGAIVEYIVDVLPTTPSRTQLRGLIGRLVAGGIAGWWFAELHGGNTIVSAVLGVAGAVIGTYGGHTARIAAIRAIGGLPAAIVEDFVAIGLAALIVTR
jgi:uncharacterized membrane protein